MRSKPRVFLARCLYALVSLFLFFAHPSSVNAEEAEGNPYLDQLISQAVRLQLADEREWHLLLHYRPNLFGGYTSEADDPQFFLSPFGRSDSQAELEGTIRLLFSTKPVGSSKQPAQCSFIARYHWLKDRLAIDETKLPVISCERFDLWINELNAESITLIFASAYLDNPASMFGHTFLRVDQKGQTEQTRILAYTINYAAEVPPNEGALYPLKGIFGGFKGYFSTPPYYLKVQEYRDIENRDIWEYRLHLSDHQVRRLLEHAWELGSTYFDYFFFKENCSYHILSLLEYADPTLHLTDQFHVWTVPADTVRLVAAQPGLVTDTMYRPSRRTVIQRKREQLSGEEHRLFVDITEQVGLMKQETFVRLPIQRQAFILDVTSDYLRYRSETDKSHATIYKEKNRAVLAARSTLRIPSEDVKIDPFSKQPDFGHGTSRVSVGAGWRNNDTFEELSIRAGYHDLLDPEIGHTQDAQVEIASLSLRHYNRADQTRIERATLVNILSLSPMDSLSHGPSWKFNVGMNTIRHNGCQLCSNGVMNGGVGAAVESHWLKREVYFAFAETEANYSKAYEERHRIGGGGTVGMLSDLTDRWRVMLSGTYLKYVLGEQSDDIRWLVGSRYTLAQNWAIRLEYNHRDRDNDVIFSVQAFFRIRTVCQMSILDQFFVFHPEPWQDRDWARLSGLPLEDVWFTAADGMKLFGWYVEAQADRPVILWCHGNAGNIINRLENLKLLYQLGLSVFLFDYRGYGRSQGKPSEEGLYQDALGAHDYLTRIRMIRPERIVIFGRSLGASVAGELAVQKPAAGLILESSFPSIGSVAKFHYGGLPVHWLLGADFTLIDRLPQLSLPKLIIHGDKDDIIPIELGRQVFEAAKPPKSFYVIEGADHNNTYQVGGAAYLRRWAEFVQAAVRA